MAKIGSQSNKLSELDLLLKLGLMVKSTLQNCRNRRHLTTKPFFKYYKLICENLQKIAKFSTKNSVFYLKQNKIKRPIFLKLRRQKNNSCIQLKNKIAL